MRADVVGPGDASHRRRRGRPGRRAAAWPRGSATASATCTGCSGRGGRGSARPGAGAARRRPRGCSSRRPSSRSPRSRSAPASPASASSTTPSARSSRRRPPSCGRPPVAGAVRDRSGGRHGGRRRGGAAAPRPPALRRRRAAGLPRSPGRRRHRGARRRHLPPHAAPPPRPRGRRARTPPPTTSRCRLRLDRPPRPDAGRPAVAAGCSTSTPTRSPSARCWAPTRCWPRSSRRRPACARRDTSTAPSWRCGPSSASRSP